MSGLMGGLIGAGIGGLLLGHGFFGGGLGFGGFLGFLLQIFLLVVLVRFVIRLFRGQSARFRRRAGTCSRAEARRGRARWRGGFGRPSGHRRSRSGRRTTRRSSSLLQGIQAAWSRAGPERTARHSDAGDAELFRRAACRADQPRRAQRGSPTCGCCRATCRRHGAKAAANTPRVAMRFSMIDVTRDASGRIVDGSPSEHVTATELWTFVRSPGGQWILSAIQQAR